MKCLFRVEVEKTLIAFKYRKVTIHERKNGQEKLYDDMYEALVKKNRNQDYIILKLRGYFRKNCN